MTQKQQNLFGIEKLNIKRSNIPLLLMDYSARIQTVHKETNPRFYKLINEFKKSRVVLSGYTSFNVRGEPIVCSQLMHSNVLWELIWTF